jgi:hypothetical protein
MKGHSKALKGHGGRIFISYRRRDSTWFVGRLYDSLSRYFGDQRVFRDVGDIQGGADFHVVLEETLGSADALIAVIGPEWLTATDQDGNPALGAPNDWLTQEIGTALDRGIPVYPVLLDGAQMPRVDELPESLRRLARFNAVSIGDDRWDTDVTRLANIVGLDIPSANERQLNFWNRLATAALVGAVWLTMGLVAARYLDSQQWFYLSDPSTCGSPRFGLIEKWQSGLVYLAIVPCVVLFFVVAARVAPAKRRYLLAAAWVGGIGAAAAFVLYLPICGNFEAPVLFFLGVPLLTTVLGLMNLSGFTPK